MNRSDLMEPFGLSVNQASTGLNRHVGLPPDNMVHDKSAQIYVRGSGVTPEVSPCPELSDTPAKGIAPDDGMRGGRARIKVRRALLSTTHSGSSGSNTDPGAQTPQDQQSVFLDRREVIDADH